MNQLLDKDVQDENISWSAHFASLQGPARPPAVTALLPLFRDNAHSVAMIKHGMNLLRDATNHLNEGQTPVLTVDQPLYSIANTIQWTWPDKYGEDKFVVLLGGLHTEMAMLSVIGYWLHDSGWDAAISSAQVTTEGRADHLLKGHETAQSQWTHQVSAAALYHLMNKSYATYEKSWEGEEYLTFQA